MSDAVLLDANAVIALVVGDHEHHERAAAYAASVERVALCPITEGALLRFLLRVGESRVTAEALLAALRESPLSEFWADSISYAQVELRHVTGHRQVTDAYLAGLARSRGATLATFDRGLAQALPDTVRLVP